MTIETHAVDWNALKATSNGRERPIIFSSEMVRAILDGRKTMTRRVVKPQPDSVADDGKSWSGGPSRPFCRDGDRLWVRESWANVGAMCENEAIYKADDPDAVDRWDTPVFMPRWASRLTLEVVSVHVERLQDINEANAIAEGFERREHFIRKWDELNGKRGFGFDNNPWVWVIQFKKEAV